MSRWYVVPGFSVWAIGGAPRQYSAASFASLDDAKADIKTRNFPVEVAWLGPYADSDTPFVRYEGFMANATGLAATGTIYEVEAESRVAAIAAIEAWQAAQEQASVAAKEAERLALQAHMRAAGPLVVEGVLTWDYSEIAIKDDPLLERLFQHFTGERNPKIDQLGRVRITVEWLGESGEDAPESDA
ncbi:MAG: hypothetical protein WC718_07155 [Phycisphaerales bacterium]|jgi:hypothetical protein